MIELYKFNTYSYAYHQIFYFCYYLCSSMCLVYRWYFPIFMAEYNIFLFRFVFFSFSIYFYWWFFVVIILIKLRYVKYFFGVLVFLLFGIVSPLHVLIAVTVCLICVRYVVGKLTTCLPNMNVRHISSLWNFITDLFIALFWLIYVIDSSFYWPFISEFFWMFFFFKFDVSWRSEEQSNLSAQ